MNNSLFAEPKFKLITNSIALSERVGDVEREIDRLLTEGRQHPNRSVGGVVKHVLSMAKRNDPLLGTYSIYLAKTIITLKLLSDLLDKKNDRTSIILKDIFHKVDASMIKSNMIKDKADLIDTIERAIDKSFATRKMKSNLKQSVDDLYDVVEKKAGMKADSMRQLATLIKRGGDSPDRYEQLESYLTNFMEK